MLSLEDQEWTLPDGSQLNTAMLYHRFALGLVAAHDLVSSGAEQAKVSVGDLLELIGGYGVLDHLGDGSFGKVYLAIDARRDPSSRAPRLVALKRPTEALLERFALAAGHELEGGGLSQEEERRRARDWARLQIGQAFAQEALLTARLALCPHVVAVLDQDITEPSIVLEYCDGGSLAQRLRRPYSLGLALRWGREIACALEAAHSLSPDCLIHRDLKPENVLLSKGKVKVSDCGTSQMAEGTDSLKSLSGGYTPVYAAPEAFEGRAYPATDVWSLGVMLYEMVSGVRPFLGGGARLLHQILLSKPKPLDQASKIDLPPALPALVHACLNKLPKERPSAEECRERLEELQASLDAAQASEDIPQGRRAEPAPKGPTRKGPAAAVASDAETVNEAPGTSTVDRVGDGASTLIGTDADPDAGTVVEGGLEAASEPGLSSALFATINTDWFAGETTQVRYKSLLRQFRDEFCAEEQHGTLSDEIGSWAKRAIAELGDGAASCFAEGLSDDEAPVRQWAAIALARLGEAALPALRSAARGASPNLLKSVISAAGEIGPEGVPVLIDALSEEDSGVCQFARFMLEEIGAPAVTALGEALDNPRRPTRLQIVFTLRGMGTDAVPALARALSDPDAGIRQLASDALAELGVEALPALLQILETEDTEQRRNVVFILGEVGEQALPALGRALSDQDKGVRRLAAEVMGELDQVLVGHAPGHSSASGLIQRSSQTDRYLRESGRSSRAEALISELSSRDRWSRREATVRLAGLGPAAIPSLERALVEGSAELRVRVVQVLGSMGGLRNQRAIELLAYALEDPDISLRQATVYALRGYGSAGLGLLEMALADPSPQLRRDVVVALRHIGPEAIRLLEFALGDSDPDVRHWAEDSLAQIDPSFRRR